MTTFFELLFPQAVSPNDLLVTERASLTKPGRVRLKGARVRPCEGGARVTSGNGGKLIGILVSEAEPPFRETYEIYE